MKDKRKRTHEEYLKKLEEKNIKIKPLEKYVTSRIEILHECFCGEKWYVKPNNIVTGTTKSCGCTSPKKQLTHKQYLEKLKELNIKVKPLEKYDLTTTKIWHICECGEPWNAEPKAVLKGHLCGCRSTDNNPMQHEEYLKRLEINQIRVVPIERYVNKRTKIDHKCICGTIWSVRPDRVLNGVYCGCTMSKEETKVDYYLETNNYQYQRHYGVKELRYHPKGKPLEFDFALFNNEKIIAFIEYNGKQHYEFVPFYHKDFFIFLDGQGRDHTKREYAKSKKIPLIEIPYWANTIEYLELKLKKFNLLKEG
jgi:hypothetical protein